MSLSGTPHLFTRSCELAKTLAALIGIAGCLTLAASPAHAQSGSSASPSTTSMIYEGFTEPKHDIMVAATEIGRLEEVTVDVGDRVTAGQLIGHLENALQRSSVRIAKLQTEMTGELDASEAEVELRRNRAELLRQLASDGMARPDELKRAETDLRIASARLLSAQEQLKLRKLELERYELQLERRHVRIPMDGIISEVFHKPGEYVTPADPAVVRLMVMDQLHAVFNIPVEDVSEIEVGTPARVFLRSSSRTIDAEISSISPHIDGESGTVEVRVELDNTDGRLLSGDRCTLRLMPHARPKKAAPIRSTMRQRRTNTQ